MKLSKFIKLVDPIGGNVKIFIGENVVYSGSIIPLQVNLDTKEEIDRYIKECAEDGDFEEIDRVKKCKYLLDYKLEKPNEEYAPIDLRIETNKYGVKMPIMYISLRG